MEKFMQELVFETAHYMLPVLAVAVLILCFSALFKRRPASLGKARLINTVNADVYPLVSRETSVGRHKNCDIILNYPTVSKVHAVIICTKDGWYITGIRSGTDVIVNGNPVEKKSLLVSGDKITLGSINLIFENKQG